ncbi:nucleotide-diphospho-sugar transferase [Westerdykella ornata]|uniref:Nucleotide-diphospho-sugar transferase n=1 Tax=Westerdykella ornata TaxID=318751 RepID=A0A6A6JCH1_WESOR|nr:nucleotide-diphospho-sugar transferase [Westerdykella ornata]KAF2274261.1 nucleotide-diphospho-sugar transferase [Westerdykella ornata]
MLLRQTHLTTLGTWVATLLLGCAFTAVVFGGFRGHSLDILTNRLNLQSSRAYDPQLVSFWKDLATALEAARPQCAPINVTAGEMSDHDKNWEPLLEKQRPKKLNLPEEDEIELTRAHRQMRLAARRLAPAFPVGEGKGIVTTGGLKLFTVLLVSLRMLRRTGCSLPVEVFLGDRAEYETVVDTCEKILPRLNARCRVISDIYFEADVAPPDHFQFKVLAILFSSFEHVLFLDADSFPVHDPTPLLSSPPYTTHGLVTWPGFYANAASSHFYHIAGIEEPPVNRGTESGQLLLNKHHHRESLLMMVYYNYYGPEYYYPLQAQGGPGQGDKETFAAGALAVNAPGPFYKVKTPVIALGQTVNGQYVFAGAAQADPIQDVAYEPPPPNHILKDYQWSEDDAIAAREPHKAKARAFFVHTVSEGTKLDPSKLLREGGLAWDPNGNFHRIWGDEKWVVEKFGFDVEKRMWECVQEEACRMDSKLCSEVKRYRKKVFSMTGS